MTSTPESTPPLDGDLREASEVWLRTEVADAYDALKTDPAHAIPADEVRRRFEEKWS